jgi:hypothetical protein
MAWSWVQSCGNAGSSVSTVAATFTTANVTAGNKYVVAVASSNTATSVKNGAGTSLTQLASVHNSTNGVWAYLYALDIPAGDDGTKPVITYTPSSSSWCSLVVQEVSGLLAGNTSAMLDGSAGTSTGSGTTTTSPSYSSAAASEYLVAAYADDGEHVAPALSGWTADPANYADATSLGSDCAILYTNSTGGAESAALNPAKNWAEILVAFQLAPPGGLSTVGGSYQTFVG